MPASGWTKSILGLRWLLSRAHSGVCLTHRRNFKNRQEKRKATMINNRSRVLCYSALPMLFLVACVVQPTPAGAQMTSLGVDCSQIQALQLLKQDNLGAGRILIECGIVQ